MYPGVELQLHRYVSAFLSAISLERHSAGLVAEAQIPGAGHKTGGKVPSLTPSVFGVLRSTVHG